MFIEKKTFLNYWPRVSCIIEIFQRRYSLKNLDYKDGLLNIPLFLIDGTKGKTFHLFFCRTKTLTMSFRILSILFIASLSNCSEKTQEIPQSDTFYFGADLSYVNQVLDHNGVYKDEGVEKNPFEIFKAHGTNLVRLRLWHHPVWTKEIYGASGTQLYNDLKDVEQSIKKSKDAGMQVLLDFHYSDFWADPANQEIPTAWQAITSLPVLTDSIYQYTFKTLRYLDSKGLMPEFVQLGNETNCGMLFTNGPTNFPAINVCDGSWNWMGQVFNSAIKAVDDAAAISTIKTKKILHVADPKNLDWWFTNMTTTGKVTDYDIIGFSYYPLWHTTVSLGQLSLTTKTIKEKFNKDIMILETAYPWTTEANDGYNNLFGSQPPLNGYPFTQQGQYDILTRISQAIKDAGGIGIVYWEPAWITSEIKDSWGTGSSWENNAFFDYEGNVVKAMDYPNFEYK